MKSWVNRVRRFASAAAALSAAVLCFAAGCTRTGDETLGYEFIPEGQHFEMRHKSFALGTVKKYDVATDEYTEDGGHKFFISTLYRTDSIISSNLRTGYAGVQFDKVFGKRTAGFASEYFLYYNTGIDSVYGVGYLPILDSVTIDLSVSDWGGDTLRPITYRVYEIISSIADSYDDEDDDTTDVAYINHDMTPLYDETKPLFEFSYPDPLNGIYTTTTSVTAKIPAGGLAKDGATWDFVRRLMLIEDDDPEWDGYGNNDEVYLDDDVWLEQFHGLYIKPVEDQLADGEEGGVYAFDLASSGFTVYGRNRNPDEPMLVKDTVSLQYIFYDSNVSVGNNSVNTVSHDFGGSLLDGAVLEDTTEGEAWSRDDNRKARTESAVGYVDGLGGVVTELYLTDDFMRELRNLSAEDGFSYAGINQARLHIYLEGSDYDWTKLDAATVTPLLNAAQPRLGLYTDYVNLTPVPDYSYLYETDDSTLAFDGYLGRSRASYVMDISSYVQLLKNYVDELNPAEKDEEGNLTYDTEFDYEAAFNAEDDDYVPRTLYIAPEAYGLYSFKRSAVQAMEDAVNNASLRLEITYTMLK